MTSAGCAALHFRSDEQEPGMCLNPPPSVATMSSTNGEAEKLPFR